GGPEFVRLGKRGCATCPRIWTHSPLLTGASGAPVNRPLHDTRHRQRVLGNCVGSARWSTHKACNAQGWHVSQGATSKAVYVFAPCVARSLHGPGASIFASTNRTDRHLLRGDWRAESGDFA